MDVAHGFGLLALGMTLILVAGLIIHRIINHIEYLEKEEKENKERNKIFGNDV